MLNISSISKEKGGCFDLLFYLYIKRNPLCVFSSPRQHLATALKSNPFLPHSAAEGHSLMSSPESDS